MKVKSLSWNSDILRRLTPLGINGGCPTGLRVPETIPSFPVPPCQLCARGWRSGGWRRSPRVAAGAGGLPFPPYPPRLWGTGYLSKGGMVEGLLLSPFQLPKLDSQPGPRNYPLDGTPWMADLMCNYHGGSLSGCGAPGTRQQGRTPWSGHNRSSCCSRLGCGAAG